MFRTHDGVLAKLNNHGIENAAALPMECMNSVRHISPPYIYAYWRHLVQEIFIKV
jgi:hypothetical protein